MAIKRKPSKPSSVKISRNGATFRCDWKKATTTGDAAVSSVYVTLQKKEGGKWSNVGSAQKLGASVTHATKEYPRAITDKTPVKGMRFMVEFSNSKGRSEAGYDAITFEKPAKQTVSIKAEDYAIKYSLKFPADKKSAPMVSAPWNIKAHLQDGTVSTVKTGDGDESKALSGEFPVNPEQPTKYVLHSRANGSHGDQIADASLVVAVPSKPEVTGVERNGNSYRISWNYNNESGWKPAGAFTVNYSDTAQSATVPGSWSSLASDVNANARVIVQAIDELPEDGQKRWFMVSAERHGVPMQGDGYIDAGLWGAPEPPSVEASGATVTVTPTPNHSPDAIVHVIRMQDGNDAEILTYEAALGAKNITDDGIKVGVPYRYAAYIVNVGAGELASETAYSDGAATPAETFVASWRKSDDCQTAFVAWEKPEGSVSGYEVAWADSPDAFTSNEKPSTLEVDGADTLSARISGLEPGKEYWFWVRTVSSIGAESQSAWVGTDRDGAVASLIMANAPDVPVPVMTSTYAVAGRDSISVGWTYSALGGAPQTGWNILLVTDGDSRRIESDGATYADEAAVIDAAELPAGVWSVFLTVTNAMGSTTSEAQPLRVVEPPAVSISSGITGGVVRALPITMNATSNGPTPVVEIVATESMSVELPGGSHAVYEGEVVFSAVADAQVEASPQLYEGCAYAARAYAYDAETGLTGFSESVPFSVDWTHQAAAGSLTVEPDPDAVACTITTQAPDGVAAGDYCSVWRVTADGASLVLDGVQFGQSIVDPFAPYGGESCAYRICTNTADGDFVFADYADELRHDSVRIDFGGSFVDLPYNISSGDKRAKDGAVRKYLDGHKVATMRHGITRTHSIATDLIRDVDEPIVDLLYSLSRYEGVCMVRIPSGIAYEATMNVSIDRTAESSLVSISIDAEEVDQTDEFTGELAGA